MFVFLGKEFLGTQRCTFLFYFDLFTLMEDHGLLLFGIRRNELRHYKGYTNK